MRARLVVAAVGVGLLTSACGLPDVTTMRLPGAAGGHHTYPVDATFDDVLDLVPNSTVRVADVPVGRVTKIEVEKGGPNGHVALVHMQISDSTQLPANTVAAIRDTSLLGEKYVALTAPSSGTGSLRQAQHIPLASTTDDVEVEDVLGSLGALLNGGGIQQLSTITTELSNALDGHETDTRELLARLDSLVTQLDQSRTALVSAIDSASTLASTLAAQKQVLGDAVTALDPATGVLAQDQKTLDQTLAALDALSGSATGVIQKSTAATVADLNALAPVAKQLGQVAAQIPGDLSPLITYPFADNAVPAFSSAYGAFKGSVTVDLPTLFAAVIPSPTSSDYTQSEQPTGIGAVQPSTGTTTTSPSTSPSTTTPTPAPTTSCGLLTRVLGSCPS